MGWEGENKQVPPCHYIHKWSKQRQTSLEIDLGALGPTLTKSYWQKQMGSAHINIDRIQLSAAIIPEF